MWRENNLLCAIKEDDIDTVRRLLSSDRGSIDDVVDELDRTPLHYAAFSPSDKVQIMEILLKNNASVTACCALGKMPLHYAAEHRKLQKVECLLKHGAPINATRLRLLDSRHYTPLHYACQSRHNEKVITLLLNRGANVKILHHSNVSPLDVAVIEKRFENVKILVKYRGVYVNPRADYVLTVLNVALNIKDPLIPANILKFRPEMNYGGRRNVFNKALLASTSEDYTEVVDSLAEYGLTICLEDANYSNLLYNAVEKGCLKTIEDLLKNGEDINRTSSSQFTGHTPLLHVAVSHDDTKVVELLIKYGIDVHAKNLRGRTPIFTAIHAMNKSMIKLLLWNGANVNDNDPSGKTPLHHLVFWKNPASDPEENMLNRDFILGEIAKLCLSEGANVDAQTDIGFTPLHCAVAGKHAKIVEALLEYNADVNCAAVQDGNRTPLHYSAATGNLIMCNILLENGAEANAKDKNGITPLHVACNCIHANIVKVLLKYGAEINSRDNKDRTPVHIAVIRGSSEIVKILLRQGSCEVDSTSKYGTTALDSALLLNRRQISKFLLDYGSNIGSELEHVPKLKKYLGDDSWTICNNCELFGNTCVKCIHDYDYEEYNNVDDYDNLRQRIQSSSRPKFSESLNTFIVNKKTTLMNIPAAVRTLRPYILKVNALFGPIATNDLMSIITDCRNTDLVKFKREEEIIKFEREQEIIKLKVTKVGGSSVSYHDVLTKGTRKLSSYAKNKRIKKALELVDNYKMFPIYSGMIYSRFIKILYRNHLLNECQYSLDTLAGFKIPDPISMELLSYLNNNDLKNLMKSYCPQSQD